MAALRLMTADGAWFSRESGLKGVLRPGAYADLAVLDRDYFTVAQDQIQDIVSVLTVVAGKIVYGGGRYAPLAPPIPPVSPTWSPVRKYGGYSARAPGRQGHNARAYAAMCDCNSRCMVHAHDHFQAAAATVPAADPRAFWGALGCSCNV